MILVTGGTGLLGSHLLMELGSGGRKVRALKRPSSDLGFLKSIFSFYQNENLFDSIEWVDGDLNHIDTLKTAMQGIEQIYHCAATVTFSSKNRDDIFSNNVVGTANLIDVALSAGVKKICHVSSIAALGKDTVITEKTIWDKKHSHSVYGESKHESELEAWRGIAEGLETIIVNPSVIIGPWKVHTGIGKFFMQIQKGLKYYTGGSNGFVDVRDVAKIMVLLMEGDFKNESFLVSGSNVSFRNLSEIISKLLGTMAPARNAPVFLTDIACRLSQLKALVTGQPSGFDRDTARISQTTSIYSNQKITEALHFSFIPIEQSLSHYYKFYKVHETFH